MKSKLDIKGRISIPKSIQDSLNLSPGDSFKIEMTDSGILLQPDYMENRNNDESVIVLHGKNSGKSKYLTVK
jgi:AbrB family looped-hinge helix DNA binding protein